MAATDIGGSLKNSVDGYVALASDIKGGYAVVKTITERDSIPSTNIVKGSLVYVSDEDKTYKYTGTAWVETQGGISGGGTADGISNTETQVTVNTDDGEGGTTTNTITLQEYIDNSTDASTSLTDEEIAQLFGEVYE